jgi:thiol-disulfide isomerase/thioredoxin
MKNLTKAVLSILAVACLSAYGSPKTIISPGTVVISGQIINRGPVSPQTVQANFQNPFDGAGSNGKVTSLDSADGSFRIEYEMPYGQTINIRYGNLFITFYAEPGDNIGVTVDAAQTGSNDWGKIIRYSGDKAELNTRFTPASNRFNAMHFWFDDKLSPDEFLSAVRVHLQTCRDSLAAYARREQLSKNEVRLLDNEIVGGVLYRAGQYREGESQVEIMKRLFTEVVDILDSRYASSEIYSNNLTQGYMMRCLIDPALLEDPAAFMHEFIRVMRDRPAGLARDIMVYTTLCELGVMFPDIFDEVAGEAQALFDSDYARERFAMLTDSKEIFEIEPMPLEGVSLITPDFQPEPLPKVDMLKYLAEKHPGKVIYIDASAHFCRPCIEEIPYMKKLEESMAGEDVVFVVLWLESAFDSTVKLMREYDMRCENYFFPTDASRLFCAHYGISQFPTYMLVDRGGKLVNRNAGRPSGGRTAQQIRELL